MSLQAAYRALRREAGLDPDAENPYIVLNEDLREIIARSGLTDPGPTLVGEVPHQAYNAKARAVPGGTLILLNAGLNTLLLRVALTLAAGVLPSRRDERNRLVARKATAAEDRLRDEADARLADAVLDYVHQSPRLASDPQAHSENHLLLAEAMWYSAERFVVGHEFGHLLAGHLHEPPGRTDPCREFEADEIATLLVMRVLEDVEPILRGFVVVGPFLFLAVDHLINRVRTALFELPEGLFAPTHPPSDVRAAALRAVVERTGEPSLLQFANTFVASLSMREDAILQRVAEGRRPDRR
jgi:hypothetical protein